MRRGDLAGIILLAIRYRPVERVSGLPLAGVVLGLVGVGVLATLFYTGVALGCGAEAPAS